MSAADDEAGLGSKTPPVDATEVLVRQVKEGGGNPLFFDTSRAPKPVLHRSLFMPQANDTDGLSLIRLRYRSEVWAAFRKETPDQRYRLARLLPSELMRCARIAGLETLNFTPTPDELDRERGEPWAHCVANEINIVAYKDAGDPHVKKRIFTWAEQVCRLVSTTDITGPYPPPDPGKDSYRPDRA
jgi:hypothetical protein